MQGRRGSGGGRGTTASKEHLKKEQEPQQANKEAGATKRGNSCDAACQAAPGSRGQQGSWHSALLQGLRCRRYWCALVWLRRSRFFKESMWPCKYERNVHRLQGSMHVGSMDAGAQQPGKRSRAALGAWRRRQASAPRSAVQSKPPGLHVWPLIHPSRPHSLSGWWCTSRRTWPGPCLAPRSRACGCRRWRAPGSGTQRRCSPSCPSEASCCLRRSIGAWQVGRWGREARGGGRRAATGSPRRSHAPPAALTALHGDPDRARPLVGLVELVQLGQELAVVEKHHFAAPLLIRVAAGARDRQQGQGRQGKCRWRPSGHAVPAATAAGWATDVQAPWQALLGVQ